MRINHIEQVACRIEKVDLVRRHQCAERQRIGLDEGDGLAVRGGIGMERKIDTLDDGVA